MADESFKDMWQVSDCGRHHGGERVEPSTQIQILTQRNYELTALVTTLVDMLGDAGHIDINVLLAKVEGQIDTEAPKAAAKPAGPKVATTHCLRCGTEVPTAQAEMTVNGLMCARCAVSA